ncbi:acyl-CoA thioesterase [Cryptosporangium phraense]|uniref:Acyl-CoA thioesterase n=1 Tax=Cryptosporangium phraense TaxID=2593070 RepID=A0A545APP1_9ACTN|nr:thioesterase family protein [Cryptosporangium phraense]TQS43263.1 acyl-CoA thioesterase [Cryptosporangium phraense]
MPNQPTRAAFPVLRAVPTRWSDNDHYGHVNNVVYYSYFDTAVNGWLIDATGCDIRDLPAIGLVVETSCQFFRPVGFPDPLEVGLAVDRLGHSSVVYRLAVFRHGDADAVAVGRFVHVYVDSTTRRKCEIPPVIRTALELVAEKSAAEGSH